MEENLQQNVENMLKAEAKKSEQVPYDSPLKPLRTYQGDVDQIIGKNKVSMVTVAVAEQKKKYDEPAKAEPIPVAPKMTKTVPEKEVKTETPATVPAPTPVPKPTPTPTETATSSFYKELAREEASADDMQIKSKFSKVIGIILVVFGIVVVGLVYYMISSQNTAQVAEQKSTLISYTQEFDTPIAGTNRSALVKTIVAQKNGFSLPANSILYINMANASTTASAADAFKLLAPNMPAPISRNLKKDYMVGVYSFDTNEPFIIFTTDDYGVSYSGMLEWEGKMTSDIGPVFGMAQASTTMAYTWKDEAIRNKDLRIVQDGAGKTILLYSFLDKNTILITTSEKIFNAILGKYMTSKMVR